VDLIRLDVSVLERDRRPVTGLTTSDFTVTEDGVVQKISAFTEVLVRDREPKATAWMRLAPVDVSSNDLIDQVGEGRPYAIVMDDWNIQADDLFLVHNARAAGREIVGRLGASDVAAVIFVHQTGRTVDFTTDRVKLMDAINGFEGRDRDALMDLWLQEAEQRRGPPNPLTPKTPSAPWSPGGFGGGTGGADMPTRSSVILGRSECERRKPLVPALEVAARRLAMVPERRKTIALVSIGMPLIPGPGCDGILYKQMQQVYGVAEQANINIYTVDVSDDQRSSGTVRVPDRRLFLQDVAEYTGGLVVGANGESTETSVERIFAESGSYYLIGYQSSRGAPDGKFRRIEVTVNRPYVTVRSRNGYFAPTPDGPRVHPEMDRTGLGVSSLWDSFLPSTQLAARPPSANSLALSGLYPPAGLPLRVSAVPIGVVSGAGARGMDVAIALSVRLPPLRTTASETVTLIRHLYGPKGQVSPPAVSTQTFALPPAVGDETRYDLFQRISLPPGRHEVRLNARSATIGRDGSVFAVIDVPDVARAPVTLTGVVLGATPPPGTPRTDPLADVLPIVPTSARSFSGSETITAFVRLFQGGTGAAVTVTLRTRILDRRDQPVMDATEAIAPDAFADGRGAARQVALPLGELAPGPYLLNLTATRADGTSARRDVVFRVR
jgi:VWFA-related protein